MSSRGLSQLQPLQVFLFPNWPFLAAVLHRSAEGCKQRAQREDPWWTVVWFFLTDDKLKKAAPDKKNSFFFYTRRPFNCCAKCCFSCSWRHLVRPQSLMRCARHCFDSDDEKSAQISSRWCRGCSAFCVTQLSCKTSTTPLSDEAATKEPMSSALLFACVFLTLMKNLWKKVSAQRHSAQTRLTHSGPEKEKIISNWIEKRCREQEETPSHTDWCHWETTNERPFRSQSSQSDQRETATSTPQRHGDWKQQDEGSIIAYWKNRLFLLTLVRFVLTMSIYFKSIYNCRQVSVHKIV